MPEIDPICVNLYFLPAQYYSGNLWCGCKYHFLFISFINRLARIEDQQIKCPQWFLPLITEAPAYRSVIRIWRAINSGTSTCIMYHESWHKLLGSSNVMICWTAYHWFGHYIEYLYLHSKVFANQSVYFHNLLHLRNEHTQHKHAAIATPKWGFGDNCMQSTISHLNVLRVEWCQTSNCDHSHLYVRMANLIRLKLSRK